MIEVINTNAQFEQIRPEWNRLLEASRSNCFFLTWEWLYTWWKHLSDGRRLFVLTVRDGPELLAVVPLCWRPPRLPVWPFGTLEFLGTGTVGSDYLDVIVRQDRENVILPVLAQYLAQERSLLKLAQLREESSLAQELAGHWRELGGPLRAQSTNVCPTIRLSGHNWESYLSTLGAAHRYNYRRKLKQLTNRFDVLFEMARTEEERREALSTLVSLHSLRWRTRGGSDAFPNSAVVSFHEEISSLALDRGWLRLFTLRLDRRPVASLYGFQYNRVFYFYQSGFDTSCAAHSVGLLAMGLAIRNALEEGTQEYDLLHGAEEYKFHWAQDKHELGSLELYPPGGLGMAWRGAGEACHTMKRMVRNMLPERVAALLEAARRRKAVESSYVPKDHQNGQFPAPPLYRNGQSSW